MKLLKSKKFIWVLLLVLYVVASSYFLYLQFTCNGSLLCADSFFYKIFSSLTMPFILILAGGKVSIIWLLITGITIPIVYKIKSDQESNIRNINITYILFSIILALLFIVLIYY